MLPDLTASRSAERNTERDRERDRDRQTDRQTDRQRHRLTGKESARETETGRQTDRQSERDIYTGLSFSSSCGGGPVLHRLLSCGLLPDLTAFRSGGVALGVSAGVTLTGPPRVAPGVADTVTVHSARRCLHRAPCKTTDTKDESNVPLTLSVFRDKLKKKKPCLSLLRHTTLLC